MNFFHLMGLQGKFGDPKVRIIEPERKKKRQAVLDAALFIVTFMIEKFVWHVYLIGINNDF